MKSSKVIYSIFVLFITLIGSSSMAEAQLEITAGEIILPLDGVNVTAGYGKLKNNGNKPIQVEFVVSEKFKSGEFHETITSDGQSKMHHISSLNIDAGKTLLFERGGSHIMLYDPDTEIKAGDKVNITLKVNGKKIPFTFKIIERQK